MVTGKIGSSKVSPLMYPLMHSIFKANPSSL